MQNGLKKKPSDPVENHLITMTSQLNTYMKENMKDKQEDDNIVCFSKWVCRELKKISNEERNEKMGEITKIILNLQK